MQSHKKSMNCRTIAYKVFWQDNDSGPYQCDDRYAEIAFGIGLRLVTQMLGLRVPRFR
jgi:hypothetical protein